ncbi:hypothetical protein [Actinomyces vulturis]|uniref:hypothetical protein n=1 Tax=Actinomyces vulturis TaxID=1857645 RepID=UPI0011475180|nr:hypothetical protein [Actinomyces vulturis]
MTHRHLTSRYGGVFFGGMFLNPIAIPPFRALILALCAAHETGHFATILLYVSHHDAMMELPHDAVHLCSSLPAPLTPGVPVHCVLSSTIHQ